MRIAAEPFERGIAVAVDGADYEIRYPEEVWRDFEPKGAFAAEVAFLQTYGATIASGARRIRYDLPPPRFLDRYDRWFQLTLPYLKICNPSASFASVERHFSGKRSRAPFRFPATRARKAVVALTLGKDSLASLVLGREMGVEMSGVFWNRLPGWKNAPLRISGMNALGSELGIPVHSVAESGRAPALGEGHPAGLIWSMSVAVCGLLLLPFARHHRAGLLVVGSEYDFNYPSRTVDMSPLQTAAGTARLDAWMRALTGGAVGVTSWIHSLHAIACHRLVHGVRPEIGLHQVSCRRARTRWCQDCRTCAQSYLFARAAGRDPASLGFTRNLLGLFEPSRPNPGDPSALHAAWQEALAFELLPPKERPSWVPKSPASLALLRRTYLQPVPGLHPLPMAARSTAAARRLLLPT